MITYIKGDLFKANGILAHACNTYGAWGAGVAAVFRKKYPNAYRTYRAHCLSHSPESLVGTCFMIPDGKDTIACLFTNYKDDADGIVANTDRAVADMLKQTDAPVNMPLINAGIFNVPWERTEEVLNKYDHDFTVYRL